MTDWYRGNSRAERIAEAMSRHGFDAVLAITPENAAYLAGQSNFIATHWRIPGIYSVAIGVSGRKAIASGDFGVDPSYRHDVTYIPYLGWTESLDLRGRTEPTLTERVKAARPGGPVARPAQFEMEAVFDSVAEAVSAVVSAPRRIGVDLREVDAAAVARLTARLPGVELIDASDVIDDLRAIKDPDEIAHLRLAGN